MENRLVAHEIGDRYVLQYAGGVERLAQASREAGGEGPALEPIEPDQPLPPPALLAGEWLIGPRDRVIRDSWGCYWCVSSRAEHGWGHRGLRWRIRFDRYTAQGHAVRLSAEAVQEPALLSDAELVEILRHAWRPQDA